MKMNFRYTEQESLIHQINPLVKLVWAVSLTVVAVILDHPLFLLALLLSTLPVVAAGRVWRKWAALMQLTLYLCLAITLINVLVSYHGSHVLWQTDVKIPVLGYPAITLEALLFGVGMSLRLLTVISVFAIVTLTVHPDDILQALYKIKIPHKSVLVMSLAARFLPVLAADAERISAVQQSRGLRLEHGNLVQRIKNRSAVLIPLMSNSLDRTVQLAEAMESRAFGSGKTRVFYKLMRIKGLEWLALSLSLLAVGLAVLIAWNGWAAYQYFPTADRFALTGNGWRLLIVLWILAVSIVPLAWIAGRQPVD
jgi:energy-coupling factor transport system permease protein